MRVLAKDKYGNLIHVSQAKRGQIYYDDLGRELIIKQNKNSCFYSLKNKKVYTGLPEGIEHKKGKKVIQKLFNNQLLEECRINANQRADLLLKPNLVIEIQCSPIKLAKLSQRHIGYKRAGYKDFWVFGSKYNLSKIFLPVCYYNTKLGFHYYTFTDQGLKCIYNLTNYKQTRQEALILNLNQMLIRHSRNVKIAIDLESEYKKLQKRIYYTFKTEWQLKNEWYKRKLILQDYLIYLVIPVAVPTPSKSEEYLFKSYVLWELMGRKEEFKYRRLFAFLKTKDYFKLFKESYLQNLKFISPNLQIYPNFKVQKKVKFIINRE